MGSSPGLSFTKCFDEFDVTGSYIVCSTIAPVRNGSLQQFKSSACNVEHILLRCSQSLGDIVAISMQIHKSKPPQFKPVISVFSILKHLLKHKMALRG